MTAEATLNGVRAEVGTSIMEITPNRAVDKSCDRFTLHRPDRVGGGTLMENPAIRRFDIEQPMEVRPTTIGYTTEGYLYEMPITFCYPVKEQWHQIALDDMSMIRHWFGVNQGSAGVTGINSRYVDYETPAVWQSHPTDPWEFVTIKMLLWVDITFA